MSSDVLVSGGASPSPGDAPAVALHADARRQMMLGLETELAAFRRLDNGTRIREMSFFLGLWVAGMLVNGFGYRAEPSLLHTLLRVVGTVMTAVAINAFILLLHEGMHNTLFASPRLNRWVSVALGMVFCLSFTPTRSCTSATTGTWATSAIRTITPTTPGTGASSGACTTCG